VKKAIAAAGTEQETESLRSAISVIDSAERKGIIHKNNAARKKSRLNARIKAQKA
ncbi:MAG: 30S ribosomal protein S20, partial [Dialister micraerophilus]|nr:30S ribosomal protein S20 [Dialister micraerophilus]